jgi:hypothetical protein
VSKEPKQSAIIIDAALEAGATLWRTPAGEPYLSLAERGRVEHHPVNSRATKLWLAHLYRTVTGEPPGVNGLGEAVLALSAEAIYQGEEHPVYVRLAELDGTIYLDLTDADWRAVEVTADGWAVTPRPPVRFRRAPSALPLPAPVRGGGLAQLRSLVNVADDDDFRLLLSWMLAALRPTGPFPALILSGGQGSAESTLTRLLCTLIDPSEAPLRRPPKDERDLAIRASRHWIVTLENISSLPDWLSDALCALATGGGFSTRQLYTDSDEVVFNNMRPVVCNGITDYAGIAP